MSNSCICLCSTVELYDHTEDDLEKLKTKKWSGCRFWMAAVMLWFLLCLLTRTVHVQKYWWVGFILDEVVIPFSKFRLYVWVELIWKGEFGWMYTYIHIHTHFDGCNKKKTRLSFTWNIFPHLFLYTSSHLCILCETPFSFHQPRVNS